MPFDFAKKIADELSSREFKSFHKVRKMEVGENGDALQNPSFTEIIRYIKLKNPKLRINIFTNFQNFTKEISEIVISEHLLDRVNVNIDGHNSESYYRVKRIPYDAVKKNILDFLEIRRRYRSRLPLQIQAVTFADYVTKVYNRFGRLPWNIKEKLDPTTLSDDYSLIKGEWEKLLNRKTDICVRSPIFLWAERETVNQLGHNSQDYLCPNLSRLEHECFIAPNGDWYGCCLDELQSHVFGNVIEKSISEVYYSEQRMRFISLLKNRKFIEIGYPCSLIETCQICSI